MNEEAMRKSFDEWAAKERIDIRRHPGQYDEYRSMVAQASWVAWQAATRAAVPAWQSIETAPKDKTVILFHEEYAVPLSGTHGDGDLWIAMVPGVPMFFQPVLKPAPTHWMPFPATPEVES